MPKEQKMSLFVIYFDLGRQIGAIEWRRNILDMHLLQLNLQSAIKELTFYLRATEAAGRTLATLPALVACFTRPVAARPAAPNIFCE